MKLGKDGAWARLFSLTLLLAVFASVWLSFGCARFAGGQKAAGGANPAIAVKPTTQASTPTPTPTGFVPPSEAAQAAALGPDAPTFFQTMTAHFSPIPSPGPRDWLAQHKEPGQTYHDYEAMKPNVPDQKRHKIYLQALGDFGPDDPSLKEVADYTSRFFGLEVMVLPSPANFAPKGRVDIFTKKKQWLTSGILDYLSAQLPDDAYCLLGITMTDLYPGEDWNYVFGIATLKKRVGVYSLARYDPEFFGDSRGAEWKSKALERSCKVLSHETCHMLGMAHCVYYNCLMNGSNHLDELDSQSTFLCPICLRKLQRAVHPNFVKRYGKLRDFFVENGLEEQARWVSSVVAGVDR